VAGSTNRRKVKEVIGGNVSNYTESETEYMIESYTMHPNMRTVELLATELNRSKKSIIGKLSREGVYRREVYVSKTGEKPITKIEIVSNIADALEIEVGSISGLEKSPKETLRRLLQAVAGS
jgi:hypothetical protein